MENKEINDKINELKRGRKEFSRESQEFKEDIDREIRKITRLLDDEDIRVGDFVETTEKYKRELTREKPYSGIVVKIIDRDDANKLIVTKCLNGERKSSDISWLEKKKKVNPVYRAMFNIVADKKKIENEIKLFDVVRTNKKYREDMLFKLRFTGIVIDIYERRCASDVMTVKCINGDKKEITMDYLEKCE